jgi:hypothetical protein
MKIKPDVDIFSVVRFVEWIAGLFCDFWYLKSIESQQIVLQIVKLHLTHLKLGQIDFGHNVCHLSGMHENQHFYLR